MSRLQVHSLHSLHKQRSPKDVSEKKRDCFRWQTPPALKSPVLWNPAMVSEAPRLIGPLPVSPSFSFPSHARFKGFLSFPFTCCVFSFLEPLHLLFLLPGMPPAPHLLSLICPLTVSDLSCFSLNLPPSERLSRAPHRNWVPYVYAPTALLFEPPLELYCSLL